MNRNFLGLHSRGGLLHVAGGRRGHRAGRRGVSQGICSVLREEETYFGSWRLQRDPGGPEGGFLWLPRRRAVEMPGEPHLTDLVVG